MKWDLQYPVSYADGAPTCYIVGAGNMGGPALVPRECDLVIAADGGYAYLAERGIRCDLLMGDLDSLSPEVKIGTETKRYSPIKDDTDTMLAVKYGLERGYKRFCLYGVFGGRFDHTLGTVQTVLYLAHHGAAVYAYEAQADGRYTSYMTAVTNGTLAFPIGAKGYLSVFALDGEARGVTLKGLQYPLDGASLYPDVALGVSNAFLCDTAASVSVTDGTLLLVKVL